MDIKDSNIKNNLFTASTANKTTVSNPLVGGFSNLLNQVNVVADLMPTKNNDFVSKPVELGSSNKIEDKSRPVKDKDTKSNKVADKDLPKDKKSNSKKTEDKDAIEENLASVSSIDNTPKENIKVKPEALSSVESAVAGTAALATEALQSAENAAQEAAIITATNVGGLSGASSLMSSNIGATLDAISQALSPVSLEGVTETQLAALGSVSIINPDTGVVESTTGAALAAKLAANESIPTTVFVAANQNSTSGTIDANLNSADNLTVLAKNIDKTVSAQSVLTPKDREGLATDSAGIVDLDKSTKNGSAILNSAIPASKEINDIAVAKSDKANDIVNEMSSSFAEVEAKHNVKVDISSGEENFAYRSVKDLVRDGFTVAESIETNMSTLDKAAVQSNNQVLSQDFVALSDVNQAPLFNANIQANLADTVEVAAKASSENGISSVSTTVSTSGSEFVAHAKAQTQNKMADVTSKDVYKGMSKDIADQVKVNITKSAVKGLDKIDIQLKPEDLGTVEVKMQISKGKLQAQIVASNQEAFEVLQKEVHVLEKAFEDAGFQLDEGSLSFSFKEDSHNSEQNANQELRNYIGRLFEDETNVNLQAANDGGYKMGDKGLNIKV